jgi:hypothetical protein
MRVLSKHDKIPYYHASLRDVAHDGKSSTHSLALTPQPHGRSGRLSYGYRHPAYKEMDGTQLPKFHVSLFLKGLLFIRIHPQNARSTGLVLAKLTASLIHLHRTQYNSDNLPVLPDCTRHPTRSMSAASNTYSTSPKTIPTPRCIQSVPDPRQI